MISLESILDCESDKDDIREVAEGLLIENTALKGAIRVLLANIEIGEIENHPESDLIQASITKSAIEEAKEVLR